MKTIFSVIFISIFLSSNIFAQDPSLSFEGNKIYINNCQWGYFPVMGSIYANHIKMNNASNLDYEIYNKYTSIFSFDKGKKEIHMKYKKRDQYGNSNTYSEYLCTIDVDEIKKYKTYKDWDGKNGISDAYYDYRYKIFQQNQKQHKKPNVEFSTAQEKKDKDSNTIFSFRITNNNLSKSIVAIQFQYESTMYDLMSVIKETHVENKKISISPQTYVDYNFRIDYNSKNEGYSYRLYVIEVIYEDGSFDKGCLQIH